jgi:MOSC domain-containing protein YiiM
MEIVSINVGLPREVSWKGKTVSTGIYKSPVEGPVKLTTLNLDGDGQADLSVHGGPDKAVYAYPAEHYGFWREELSDSELSWGAFGENFTTQGLLEEDLNIGDTFRIGSAVVRVSQPRMPCYKLGIRLGRADIVKRFLASRRSGFYLSVLEEGTVQAGDTSTLLTKMIGRQFDGRSNWTLSLKAGEATSESALNKVTILDCHGKTSIPACPCH